MHKFLKVVGRGRKAFNDAGFIVYIIHDGKAVVMVTIPEPRAGNPGITSGIETLSQQSYYNLAALATQLHELCRAFVQELAIALQK